MGFSKEPRPVKLIVGMFTAHRSLFDDARAALVRTYGATDHTSPVWPFDLTTYYADEFGDNLLREFVSFLELIEPGKLPDVKQHTNSLEQLFAQQGRRQINLDPGYVDLSKLVLATTKNHQHRIYVGQGIYAEVTLRFRRKSFGPWEWTYPDYRTDRYIGFFNAVRQTYLEQLRNVAPLQPGAGVQPE